MLENENENEKDLNSKRTIIKSPRNSVPDHHFFDTPKNASSSKENDITLNNNKLSNIKKLSCKLMFDGTTGDDSKSKGSMGHKKNKNKKNKKRIEKKNESFKNRKKDKKFVKMLKNEKLKIPTGKRMSNNDDRIKLSLNNIDQVIKSLPKKNKKNTRLDTYGNKINKENKKNVHIRFLDNIPSNKLIEIIPIESFKQLNIIEKIPKKELISLCSECCQIF